MWEFKMVLEKLNNGILQFPTNLVGIFAHEDDEVLGAGGTLAKNIQKGGISHVICFGGYENVREAEFRNSCEILGVTYNTLGHQQEAYSNLPFGEVSKYLKGEIIEHKPEFIITHRGRGDYNRDHGTVEDITMDAARRAQNPQDGWITKGLLLTETHSLHDLVHVFVDIGKQYDLAQRALSSHNSQTQKLATKGGDFYTGFYDKRTALRGFQAGCERAEAFEYKPVPLLGSLERHNISS